LRHPRMNSDDDPLRAKKLHAADEPDDVIGSVRVNDCDRGQVEHHMLAAHADHRIEYSLHHSGCPNRIERAEYGDGEDSFPYLDNRDGEDLDSLLLAADDLKLLAQALFILLAQAQIAERSGKPRRRAAAFPGPQGLPTDREPAGR